MSGFVALYLHGRAIINVMLVLMNVQNDVNSRFTEAYKTYYPKINKYISSTLNSPFLADDISQDIFLRLYSYMDTVTDIRSWLYTTMRNVVSKQLRKLGLIEEMEIPEASAEEVMIACQSGVLDTCFVVDYALEGLKNEVDSLIFRLIALQKYTYDEAGEHIGLTSRQVRHRYGLALRLLRHNLSKRGINSSSDLR